MRRRVRSTGMSRPRGGRGAFGAGIGQKIHVELDDPITTGRINLVQPINGARDRYITKVEVRFDGNDTVDAELDGSSRTPTGQTIDFGTRTFRTLEIEVTGLNVGSRRLHGFSNAVGFAEVRVRDDATGDPVRVSEAIRMPNDLLDATGTSSLDHPLVVVMSRDRVVPIPPRHDPEPALAREFTLPTARAFALTGTARATSEASADALAALLQGDENDPTVVRADASESLDGCIGCRARSAIDGDLATAWQTPFDEVRGQYVDYDVAAPITFDHMDLAVVADGRHSVPTRIRLEVDGEVRDLALPPIADQPGENATTTVPISFAPVTGRNVRVTIVDIREASTFNFYAQGSSLLPVGIAELGIPGLHARGAGLDARGRVPHRPVAHRRRAGAGADHRLDRGRGRPPAVEHRGVRPGGSEHHAGDRPRRRGPRRGGRARASPRVCSSTASSSRPTRVERRSRSRTVASTGLPATPPPTPTVEVTDDGRSRMRVHVDGADEPFWLVLGQSENAGWRATTDGATLGDRTLVDGYANGWLVDPTQESFDVVLEWTPQERVWASLWVSLAGVIACLAIVAVTWWLHRRGGLARNTAPDPDDGETALEWPGRTSRPRESRAGRGGSCPSRPASSARWLPLRGSVCSSGSRSRSRSDGASRGVFLAIAPAALVVFVGLYIAFAQVRYQTPPVFEWPTVFPRARSLAWIAVLLARCRGRWWTSLGDRGGQARRADPRR